MGAFKSNWISVANTCNGLSGIGNKLNTFLTTCFNWHANYFQCQQYSTFKLTSKKQEHIDCNCFSRELTCVERISVKNIRKTLKSQFIPATASAFKCKQQQQQQQQQQQHHQGKCFNITAKLLSSTLIEAAATTTTAKRTTLAYTKQTVNLKAEAALNDKINEMTIAEDTFIQVREDNPDLDAEIRSILISRAQDGATISDIKTDYYKNTGMRFPIHSNITDFLLTIPMVTAMCNPRGMQIFNIIPSEKTQHLFNLIMGQKSQPQQQQQHQQQQLQQDYTTAPRKWRYNSYRKETFYNRNVSNNNNNCYYNNNNIQYRNYSQVSNAKQQQQLSQHCEQQEQQQLLLHSHRVEHEQLQQQQQVNPLTLTKHADECDSDKDSNYYRDNCNHLYSRLCNPQLMATPLSGIPATELNVLHYNSDFPKKIFHNQSQTQLQLQQPSHNQTVQLQQQNNEKGEIKEIAASVFATDHENINNMENQKFVKRKHVNALRKFMNIDHRNDNASSSFCRYSTTSYAKSSQCNDSCYLSCESEYEAHLYDFPLLGDDFFLFLARMELNCKFKMNEVIYQAGLCVSGQTIRAAIKRVQRLGNCNHRIIVNIGSVDIMRGRKLLQIEHDYRELINVMHKKGLVPILTTLPPLANYMHVNEMKQTWERFNEFIKREGSCLSVIDIWSCMVNDRKQTLFDCYQKGPRTVTGATEPYVFWNKIGRQRILQKILSSLEY